MSFVDKLQVIASRIPDVLPAMQTEEQTKTTLILPFIGALGYEYTNPAEVRAEYVADWGNEKGDKIDYAILEDGKPTIFIECKKASVEIGRKQSSQLARYFHTQRTRTIGILTNGVQYKFFADLKDKNVMDEEPFLVLDLSNFEPSRANRLRHLTKTELDLSLLLEEATEWKADQGISDYFRRVIQNGPDPELTETVFRKTNPTGKNFTQNVAERYAALIRAALAQLVESQAQVYLRTLASRDAGASGSASGQCSGSGIETTVDEIEAYQVVKAIVCEKVRAGRVVLKDAKTYASVTIDGNSRQTVCRLYFNGKQKFLTLFDDEKGEKRVAIDSIDEIYDYKEQLRKTAEAFAEVLTSA